MEKMLWSMIDVLGFVSPGIQRHNGVPIYMNWPSDYRNHKIKHAAQINQNLSITLDVLILITLVILISLNQIPTSLDKIIETLILAIVINLIASLDVVTILVVMHMFAQSVVGQAILRIDAVE